MNKIRSIINKKQIKKIVLKALSYKRLLFILFFGSFLVFTFNIIYKYAYLDLNYIDYSIYNNYQSNRANNTIIEKAIKNIEDRKKRFEKEQYKKYKNPFDFEH